MPEIHLDAAGISQLKISDFADFTNPGGDQKAVIKVNGKTFHITVPADNGEARVDLGGGFLSRFLSWFDGGQREAIRKQIQDRINSQVGQWRTSVAQTTSSFRNGTKDALDTIFQPGSQAAARADRSVAVYGFSNIRFDDAHAHEKTFKDNNAVFSTIDSYNSGLRIEYMLVSLVNLPLILDDINAIANDTDGKNGQRLNSSKIPEAKLQNWAKFLQRPENLQKINIFKRLQDYIDIGNSQSKADKKLPGWKGEFARRGTQRAMEAFVRKNVTSNLKGSPYYITDTHIPLLAKALTDIANKMRNPGVRLGYDSIMASLEKANGGKKCDDSLAEALDEIVRCAFFRQTSKLGLDFFKENKTPVMFYWTTPQGFSMPDNNPTLTDKWWHRSDAKIDDHSSAYITFSEMRHVMKMQAAADGASFSLSEVMGNVIPV